MGDQVVVQLPLSEAMDFDTLVSIENGLIQLFKENRGVDVDGHDIGQGRFNIFIISNDSWASILGHIRAFLEFRGVLENALIAARPIDGESFKVLWPMDYEGTFEL